MKIKRVQDDIISEMERLEDWLDKYDYIIKQGSLMPEMPDELKTEEKMIKGCQSGIWMDVQMREGVLKLSGDSDAKITKGMLALVIRILDSSPPRDIAEADLYFAEKTGLSAGLSPARSDGLQSVIKHIRNIAREYTG
ncbi:MAG: SufE family protein [Candidatus Goldiibacteriota bacterium]